MPSATPPLPFGQRAYSPVPKRPSHLAPSSRPPYNPRSSSLSLISRTNSSTSSLPGTSRAPNGSTLKQQLTPPPYVDDPLEVLEKIIGQPIPRAAVANGEGSENERPEKLAADIDFDGLSLEEFANETERSHGSGNSLDEPRSAQSVEEYEKERDKFEDLHRSILACDNVLISVETSLAGFQRDLGLVSTEIETLQNRSVALNTRLDNRKVVEKLLGPAVEEISIPPNVVKTISEGQIGDDWLKALAELQKKHKSIEAKVNEGNTIKAVSEIKPLLENLTAKATERIRDYLVSQIKAIRAPNINAQIIQQQNLLRYKDVYVFLVKHHAKLAEEIGQAYVNTMRWYYLNGFTKYRQALDKLTVNNVDKTDALGSDPSAPKPKGPATHDPYNIGRRADILKTSSQSAISSYLAEEDKSSHYIETPYRSYNLALIDNVSAEYSFLTEFFSTDTYHQMSRRCTAIFEPTFALSQSLVTTLTSSSYDCLGILICIRLNQNFAFELQRRKIPVADSYINGMNMQLWPRLQVAMDFHSESIKHLSTTISARSAASKLSFTGSASDASKLSTAPHYLTQRFSQFLYGILVVSKDAGDDEPVNNSLHRLRTEYESFLQKASKGAGADQQKRDRFLGNNYSLVLTILADAEGKFAVEQVKHFEELQAGLSGK